MTTRPRLILHIGTHKTATSTLQALMAQSRRDLEALGIFYPPTAHPDFIDQSKHRALAKALTEGDAAFAAAFAAVRRAFDAAGAHTLVLSAEGLSSPAKLRDGVLDRLAATTRDFDVTAVCFLRRQDYFVESYWNQRAKNGTTGRHIDAFIELPQTRTHLEYGPMLAAWARHAQVIALGFEASLPAGIVETFVLATGIPLPAAPRARNVSPGMNHAALMAALNRRGIAHDFRAIARLLGPDPQRHALGARLRRRLLADFAAHNAALAADWGVTFPDTLPEEPDAPIPAPGRAEVLRLAAALAAEAERAPRDGGGWPPGAVRRPGRVGGAS